MFRKRGGGGCGSWGNIKMMLYRLKLIYESSLRQFQHERVGTNKWPLMFDSLLDSERTNEKWLLSL